MNILVVEQESYQERRKDSSEVSEETAEGSRANGKVSREPGAGETIVEIADKEGWKQQQNPTGDEQFPDGLELSAPRFGLEGNNTTSVPPPNLVGRCKTKGDWESKTHYHDEDNVY